MKRKRDWPHILASGEMECSRCGEVKKLEDFHKQRPLKDGTSRYGLYCKACHAVRGRKWNLDNRERSNANSRKWNLDNKERVRAMRIERDLKLIYEMTIEDYEARFVDQGGVCGICDEPETVVSATSGKKIRLAVDHDHETGEVRGLLCRRCNRGLGSLKDDVELLRHAITYLEAAYDHS